MEVTGSHVRARSVVVVPDAAPEALRDLGAPPSLRFARNRIGTVVTGPLGDFVIDLADRHDGPVYDVMYHPRTNWFAVTVYRGIENTRRWDNRPDGNAGYPRIDSILGATSPLGILDALDIDPAELGYAPS